MRQCGWRKGCYEDAYGDDRFCYYHAKRREPPVAPGNIRDLWTSEALAIRDMQTQLERGRKTLGHRGGKP